MQTVIAGFTRLGMASTLSGEPLYKACGYRVEAKISHETACSQVLPLLEMAKNL